MKTTAAILAMALAIVTASKAELGETPKEFEPRKADRVEDYKGATLMMWHGKKLTHAGAFKNGRAIQETFHFIDDHAMTGIEIGKFTKPYENLNWSKGVETDDGTRWLLTDASGSLVAVIVYVSNTLQIWDAWFYGEVFNLPRTQGDRPPASGCGTGCQCGTIKI